LPHMPGMIFEAHSTDYQVPAMLAALVRDGFSILKVGPGLTFALRQALYGLDAIAQEMFPAARPQTLRQTMEGVMCAHPEHWARYYHGADAELRLQRQFSYSDRIRYYWPDPAAEVAVQRLLAVLDGIDLPEPLIGQFLGAAYADVRAGLLRPRARDLMSAAITAVLQTYVDACVPNG
ncbi:MAG TPA: class II D-tagatose-bisphosphate aldolase, non-catalytic subunit, partial [Paenirhodobacter sp.]